MSFLLSAACLTAQVTDKDGNSYPTVKIGRQEWMAVNLNTARFRNGDSIPEMEDAAQWQAAADQHRAAWCYYNGDSASGQKYHKLYNWYAVADPRGLAPEGWHIPSIGEWTALTTFLGGDNSAGIKMKAADAWDGTNGSGFEALPGGYRNHNGQFSHIRNIASWWSASATDSTDAWSLSLGYGNGVVSKSYDGTQTGLAVRCLRD